MLVRVRQVGTAVIDVHADPAAPVGMTRMRLADPQQQQRIDLHGVNVPGSLGQGDRDIIARPCSDDQDVAQTRAGDVPVRVEVEGLPVAHRLKRDGCLVGNVVRAHRDRGLAPAVFLAGQLVVGRPHLPRRERFQDEQRDDARHRAELPPPGPGQQQHHQAGASDHPPGDRRLVEEGQHRERRDPGYAAQDVQPVGVQRLEPDEGPRDCLAQPHHHAHHEHEHDGETQRLGKRVHAARATERVRPAERLQHHGEREHKAHEHQQRHRRPAHVVALGPGVEEANPDPEEAGEQHEVRGGVHKDVVRADPPDQGKFHEQHEEAGEGKPGRACGLLRAVTGPGSLDGGSGFLHGPLSGIHPIYRNDPARGWQRSTVFPVKGPGSRRCQAAGGRRPYV